LTSKIIEIFPKFKEPKSLAVFDLRGCSWDEQMTITCIQGLVNRVEPRIYLIFDDHVDRLWLHIYNERYGITNKEVKTILEMISYFADEIQGFVIYDDRMLHSANVAMVYGSIANAIPASPSVADKLSEIGLKKVADFRGKWKNRLEAYEWELENLAPKCSHRIVGSMCVDPPCVVSGPANRHHVRDYLIASKALCFDLSTKIRDRRENELFDRILGRFSSLSVVLGWHCCRDLEIEAVARAAKNGFFVLCNLSSPNLTVHSGIRTTWKFRQVHIERNAVTVEDKVYVTLVQSDGDAIWAMNNFQNLNWLDEQRGKFPYTWEIQPLLIDLAPGILEHYYRTATSNDYFIAGPSGAGYTMLSFNKRLDEFLEHSKVYFELCDLKSALIMNRDKRIGYQEIEDAKIPVALANKLEMCFGFLHGYVGSGFEPAIFVNNVPYIHTSLYVSNSSNIAEEIQRFGKGCRTRPLFVSVHVRENTRMSVLRDAIDKLDPHVYKVVKLDEFMMLLQKVKEEGRFKDVSSEKGFLKEILKEQARILWENYYKQIEHLKLLVNLDPYQMLEKFNQGMYDFMQEQLPDLLGYETIETALYIVKSALNMRGVYVNNLRKSVEDFLREFADLPDAYIVKEVYKLWQNWEQVKNDLKDMKLLAIRVIELSESLKKQLFSQK